eukprot:TRINITY_DN6404_c0_g1_i2.p1 TRINITY_DN6404_c0_g1~~TRINITY_DN6404_c0_g1_i2.p1  ORF type:complete len:475 (-),score=172.10 TRINITY_DN6404_c0_g1_i2:166-1383(-)
MLFGKRGKQNLVLLKANLDQVQKFANEWFSKELVIGKSKGPLTHFIVEPFVPHQEEYYLSYVSEREADVISFSPSGGVEVEENWDKVKQVAIPTGQTLQAAHFGQLGVEDLQLAPELKQRLKEFIEGLFKVFQDLDYTLLEMNPFTFAPSASPNDPLLVPFPLDLHCELDSTAGFKNRNKWEGVDFPVPFGSVFLPEEEKVRKMDEKTGASLKLKVLNPDGRLWLLVAGGGASVIYADTVTDMGWEDELANYGEYSGAPNEEETFQYSSTVLDLACAKPDPRGKVLIIGGAIANFTDIAKTFKGIVHALRNHQEALRRTNMKIFVRRAGPNYQTGLELMKELGKEIGIPIVVFGPEKTMTSVVGLALQAIAGSSDSSADAEHEAKRAKISLIRSYINELGDSNTE